MHFERYKEINIRLWNGDIIRVKSPYFVKAPPKDRRKKHKPGPQGEGHLGLSVLGVEGLCSANLVSEVVKLAVLCPSLEVSKEVLSERGLELDVKTIRRLCKHLGSLGLSFRGVISLSGQEELTDQTVVVGIDGGRLRERAPKRGRKKRGCHRSP